MAQRTPSPFQQERCFFVGTGDSMLIQSMNIERNIIGRESHNFERRNITSNGVDVVLFDLESTLTSKEAFPFWGEMTGSAGVWRDMQKLTNQNIEGTISFGESLKIRLEIVKPDVFMVKSIEKAYPEALTPDAINLFSVLHAMGKKVFIITGGFKETTEKVRQKLGIEENQVYGNQILLSDGKYAGYDNQSSLAQNGGKKLLVQELRRRGIIKDEETVACIGDGNMDMEIEADIKIGFGGVAAHEITREKADIFIHDLSAIIPIIAGERNWMKLYNSRYRSLFGKGAELLIFEPKTNYGDAVYGIDLVKRLKRFINLMLKGDPDVIHA